MIVGKKFQDLRITKIFLILIIFSFFVLSSNSQSLKGGDGNVRAADFPIDTPVSNHPVKMFFPTVHSDGFLELDQLLIIQFSRPLDPAFFDVDIDSGKGKWTFEWSTDFRQITLIPDSPLEADQAIQLKANVLGGPNVEQSIKTKRLSSDRQLTYDLKAGRIDMNQAARYRIYSLFKPSLVPEIYRLPSGGPSGTPLLKQVQKDFEKLDEKTQQELQPFFLYPLDPDSFWYKNFME